MNKIREVKFATAILWIMLLSACASLDSSNKTESKNEYKYTLSSGLFSLPQDAKSVDWAIINNTDTEQKFRVTIYESFVAEKAIVEPGPITHTVKPFHAFHNANSVGYQKPFSRGPNYEVVLETNSLKVLPSVQVWSDFSNTLIPGTLIGPGHFVDISK